MLEELRRRNYAESTIHIYTHTVEHFSWHFHRSPDQLGPEHIRQSQAAMFTRWKLAPNTVTQRLAALRFFHVQVLKRGWSVAETPYPKKVPGWRDSAHGNKKRLMTLPVDEFLRRFLLHLLPRGFMRIRNFGFLANRHRAKLLPLCAQLLNSQVRVAMAKPASSEPGDLTFWKCPHCGGEMKLVEKLYRRPDPAPRSSCSLQRCRMKPQHELATSVPFGTKPF
jgi:hypothetical protein